MSVVDDLLQIVPEARVSDAPSDRILYGRDAWPRDLIRWRAHDVARNGPAAIVWPESDVHVQKLVAYARDTGTSLVPFGAGSGVCGAIAPRGRSIVVDLKRFADWRVLPEQDVVEVGAGVLGINLEQQLQALGHTVGHFPSSILCSTVGGWLAARGAGQCSGLYGKIEDMAVGADTVLGTGELVTMHWRARGPNLVPLLVGSEGTLGIITRARLRLHRLAPSRAFAAYGFDTVQEGWEALRELYQMGLRPAVARLYDALDTALASSKGSSKSSGPHGVLKLALRIPRAVNQVVRALEGNLLRRCQLILIFEGQAAHTLEDASRAARVCGRHGARALGEAPARAWLEHRYAVSYRQSPIFRMGAFSDTMEVAAPWSKLDGVYDAVRRALGRYVVVLAHLSHAYPDGCSIYFTFSASTGDDAKALALYDALWPAALEAALEAGASLSHHHGVGRNKRPLLGAELGYGVEMVRRLKRAWDPDAVLNPGVLIPDEPSAGKKLAQHLSPCELDEHSLLADLDARLSLDECANLLSRRGYTLGVEQQGDETLAEWLARGMPGTRSPWEDPVDNTLVGLGARVASGGTFQLMPAPRRAVGPDLTTLFVGERRVGEVERVTLRVHPVGATQARRLPGHIPSLDTPNAAEGSAWESVVRAQLE